MRIIPKTSKVKAQFFRNISLPDMIIGIVGLILEALLFMTDFGYVRFILMGILLAFVVCLYIPVDGQRLYKMFVNLVRYTFSVKHYSLQYKNSSSNIDEFVPFKDISDRYIVYPDYYAGVLEIDSKEFRLLSGYRQDQIIDGNFGKIIRSISGKTKASLVKVDRKIYFDEFVKSEEAKRNELYKLVETEEITKEELRAREKVIDDRIRTYKQLSGNALIKKSFHYLVIYDENKSVIDEILEAAVDTFALVNMNARILYEKDLAVFLKYTYTDNFDNSDVNVLHKEELMQWIMPRDIKFSMTGAVIDGRPSTTYTVRNFPLEVLNAWGYQLFNIKNTKVVMNLEPFEKRKAVKMLDRSIQELSSQSEQSFRASSLIDKQTHISTLVDLLRMLQNDNETLFKVTLHFTIYGDNNETKSVRKDIHKSLKRILAEEGFELVDNYCRQNKALISTNISRYDTFDEYARAIHSGSVAAVFPFVVSSIMEQKGVILGSENGYPVIVDFFKRDNERVNSNMVILGKSGSGKSYATKTMLSHLAAENCKIFILDPENEYTELAHNLGGRFIDVGTASEGRINPFHIITTLDADEEGVNSRVNNFSVHLQFLEEFFRVILAGIDSDALEYLNNIIVELYKCKGISSRTDLSKLSPSDYPVFEDLDKMINDKLAKATVEYDICNLRVLHNYISKFAGEGRNSSLWDGESTLSVKENFTVFNFQSLLANKNGVIANAQMLLVLKWLDNEIIKNRDFNIKHNTNRKIVVAIDEAHVFIDPKYPVALDFMYQLAKRIRKYNGMQIVITQNIKDFVGSEEIIRKSTAIINACQYSFIFSLAPNDMTDLCVLYDKAGQINEAEQDQIVNNDRGHAFIITGPTSRTSINVIASESVRRLFGEPNANQTNNELIK